MSATLDEAVEQLSELVERLDSGALQGITSGILEEGYTFGDFSDLSDDELEAAYASAFNLIDQGKATDAEKLFRLLLTLDHHDHRFWMGLGVSLQLQKKFRLANATYAHLYTLDYENCVPPLRSAECLMNLGEYQYAEGAAIAAEAAAERQPDRFKTELASARMILAEIERLRAGALSPS